jgi:predicted aspartyl protease
VPSWRSPTRDVRDLMLYGPRLQITIGPPTLSTPHVQSRSPGKMGSRFTDTDALIDTGAQKTVVALEAIRKVGLSKINETELRTAGGIVKVDVYVASLQFPRCNLRGIEVMEVSGCDLSHIPFYRCLIGRDILSRWSFHYDGAAGTWQITENGTTPWVEPPEGFDPNLWGEG